MILQINHVLSTNSTRMLTWHTGSPILWQWPSVMLRDYQVDNYAWNFLALIAFFALKVSRKVKACSVTENRPADIFLQLNTKKSYALIYTLIDIVAYRKIIFCLLLTLQWTHASSIKLSFRVQSWTLITWPFSVELMQIIQGQKQHSIYKRS